MGERDLDPGPPRSSTTGPRPSTCAPATRTRCSRRCSPATASTSSSRAGPRSPPRSCGPAWSTRSWRTSRRCCSAPGPHAVADLGIGTIGDALHLSVDDVPSSPARQDRRRRGHQCPPHDDSPKGSSLMFTGIVEELGTVAAIEDQGDAVRLTVRAEHRARGRRRSVTRSPSTAAASPSHAVDDGVWTADVMQETLDKTSLRRRSRSATGSTSSGPPRSPPGSGGHLVQGHVDGVGEILQRQPSDHWERRHRLAADAPRAVPRRQGLDHRRRRQPHRGRGRAEDQFTVSLIPETLARTTLGARAVGGPRQPRGRRHRQARGHAGPRLHSTEYWRPTHRRTAMIDWLLHGTIPVAGGELLAREVVGNLFGLASAILGMQAFRLGVAGGHHRQRAALHGLRHRRAQRRHRRPALGPGRTAGLLHRGLALRLVDAGASPVPPAVPRTAEPSPRGGPPDASG